MRISKFFVPATINFLLPQAPAEMLSMTPYRKEKGDTYNAHLQIEEGYEKDPIWLGDVESWYMDEDGKVKVYGVFNSILRYGQWVLTGLTAEPVRTVADDEDVIEVFEEQWRLKGLSVNHADMTKKTAIPFTFEVGEKIVLVNA